MSTVVKKTGAVIALAAEMREVAGKRGAARVRKQGRIPAVVYGRTAPISISIDEREFKRQFHHVSENTLIDLALKTDTRHVIVKDYSMNPITERVLHLDFLEIEKGKMLRTHIPVVPVGISVGVRAGGVLEQPAHEVEIECLPKDLPQQIEMDITALEVSDSIHVSDLAIPQGVHILSNAEMVLCHVATIRLLKTEEAAEMDDGTEDTALDSESAEE